MLPENQAQGDIIQDQIVITDNLDLRENNQQELFRGSSNEVFIMANSNDQNECRDTLGAAAANEIVGIEDNKKSIEDIQEKEIEAKMQSETMNSKASTNPLEGNSFVMLSIYSM